MNVQVMTGRRVWLWLLALIGVTALAEKSNIYDLPSFSLVLDVQKSETLLIVFQDRLNSAVRLHLNEFFKDKLEIPSYRDGEVSGVELSSSYVWKESRQVSSNGLNKYEVRSKFDCTVEMIYSSISGNESRPSPSIMNLLLIEAFQGDNYWNLVHSFLRDEILEDITGVKISISSDGYVHNNGGDSFSSDDGVVLEAEDDWTPAMTAGIIFAGLLVFSLVLMWTYLCCFSKGAFLIEFFKFGRKKFMEKADSVTDDIRSTSSLNPEDEETEGRWMDAWAESVTSIPLREPVTTRKSKRQPAVRHPAQQYNSYLNCIEEADDECSTICSVESSRSHASNRQRVKNHETKPKPVAAVNKRTKSTKKDPPARSADSNFEFKTTMPQLDRINEMA